MAPPDLVWLPAQQVAGLIRAKKVSPVEVVDAVLARIERLNPTLNCFAAVTAEEARDAAIAAEVGVVTGETLGPLHGVPVSIKDLLFTRRVLTTGGSRLFADHVPEEDAVAVERLKGAGAIIVGKTTTPEFGHKAVTESPLLGTTRNPWNPALTSGGSSGGAAVAVATGLGPLAVGTDGGGSIRGPASFWGIYGAETAFGPVTPPVHAAALMLDVIAGPDDRDRYSLPATDRSFLAACGEGIAGLSVAWSPDLGYARVDPEVADLCAAAAERFESFGGHVEVVSPSWEDPEELFRATVGAETWSAWGDRLEADGDKMDRSFRAFLKFGATITSQQLLRALRGRNELWTEVQRFLARFDLLITPTVAVPPFEVGRPGLNEINGEPSSPLGWMPFCFPFNLTGQPAA